MCLPAAGAALAGMTSASQLGLALSAVSSIVSFVSQTQAANAQAKAVEANYEQQNEAVKRQYEQAQEQTAQAVSERAREAMVERARLRVFAGESGLGGNTVDRIVDQSRFNEGTDMATLEANRKNTMEQLHEEAKGGRARSQSQMNSIKQPSLIGTGLQIGGAFVGAMGETERLNALKGTSRNSYSRAAP